MISMIRYIFKRTYRDPSSWVLLFSNLLLLGYMVSGDHDFSDVVWTYFIQSLMIAFFGAVRILMLKNYSTEKVSVAGFPTPPPACFKLQLTLAGMVLAFIGIFHLIYWGFLEGLFRLPPPVWNRLKETVPFFFASHLFSFFYNNKYNIQGHNIGDFIFLPLSRIIPMHCFVMFGAVVFIIGNTYTPLIVFFMILKVLSDLGMHVMENDLDRLKRPDDRNRNSN